MSPKQNLQDIFNDDPFGLLNIKPTSSPARNADERLLASFQEINDFYEKNNREPALGGAIQEHQLHSRLKGIRADQTKMEMLKVEDRFNLLDFEQKQITSLNDILSDDSLGLLDDNAEGLFDLKHVKRQEDRASADFVAKRKSCKNFTEYEASFKEVQKDLATGKRKLVVFKQDNLRAGDFYVHNGILLLLEKVDFEEDIQEFKSGSRVRKDGRTRVVFENGTESNMLYRSLYKALLANGRAVTENTYAANEKFIEQFNNVNEDDIQAGFIYILKSQSGRSAISSIQHLYKIGYSKIAVEERIKNAVQEPTYLMDEVRIVMVYKCFNMNPQKLEQLLHNFFGKACLNVDVFDNEGNRHTPREWFIAPLHVIERAIHLIISGEVVQFRYDDVLYEIVER